LATTVGRIEELVRDKTVIVKPDEKNSQIHHLYINNKFKIISNQLAEINKIMDLMDEPIRRINKHQIPVARNDKEFLKWLDNVNEKPTNLDDLHSHFFYPYQEVIIMMLRLLFVRISSTAISEIDANTLRTKILRLMNRITTQIYNIDREKDYLNFAIMELKSFQLSTTKTFAKNNKIDIGLRPQIVQIIESFKKNFLS
jgi:hypothetical protein